VEYQTIIATTADSGLGTIILNRPERRNAISILMRQEISACLTTWNEDDNVRCVIITGAGNTFSSGFDLEEFKQVECHAELLASSSRYHLDLWNFSKPTIAVINGPTMGGGFDLACFATFGLPPYQPFLAIPRSNLALRRSTLPCAVSWEMGMHEIYV